MKALICNVCGGVLPETDGDTAVCAFCKTQNALPHVRSEAFRALFFDAFAKRNAGDYAAAAAVYAEIVSLSDREAEAWLGLLLCRFGVDYRNGTCRIRRRNAPSQDEYFIKLLAAVEGAPALREHYLALAEKLDSICLPLEKIPYVLIDGNFQKAHLRRSAEKIIDVFRETHVPYGVLQTLPAEMRSECRDECPVLLWFGDSEADGLQNEEEGGVCSAQKEGRIFIPCAGKDALLPEDIAAYMPEDIHSPDFAARILRRMGNVAPVRGEEDSEPMQGEGFSELPATETADCLAPVRSDGRADGERGEAFRLLALGNFLFAQSKLNAILQNAEDPLARLGIFMAENRIASLEDLQNADIPLFAVPAVAEIVARRKQSEYGEIAEKLLFALIANEEKTQPWLMRARSATLCDVKNGALLRVYGNPTAFVMPSGVKKIAARAFYGCDALCVLYLNEGLEEIGSEAFFGCESLERLVLPRSVREIAADAFTDCALREIFLPHAFACYDFLPKKALQGIFSVPCGSKILTRRKKGTAFTGSRVRKAYLNDTACLPPRAFADCTALESVDMPCVKQIAEGMEEGDGCFENCTALRSVHTGVLERVSARCFARCSGLRTVQTAAKAIGTESFFDCLHLSFVDLSSAERIESSAFAGCATLSEVRFGENLSAIGANAFRGTALKKVILPPSLIYLAKNAFDRRVKIVFSGGRKAKKKKRDLTNRPV